MQSGSWASALATVAACGGVGAFIDFYIGKAGQRRVKGWLETWWLRLSYVRWGNFGREEALFAVRVMDRLFGKRLFSAQRLICVVVSATVVWGILITLLIVIGYTLPHRLPLEDLTILVPILLFSLATSFSVTRIAAVTVARLLTKVFYLNFVGIVFLCVFQYWWFCRWGTFTQFVVDEILYKLIDLYAPADYPELISLFWLHSIDWPVVLIHSFNVGINHLEIPPIFYWCLSVSLNVLPTLIRFSIMAIFISSFLLKPLHHPIMTLWARIIESDKPVFTLLFGGTAALAGAIHEITKALW
jgi:hypothetical protein